MPVFFTSAAGTNVENRGRVQALLRPGVSPMSIVNIPLWGGFSGFKSIITNITISEQGNFQFLHTLGNEIFVYVFGDRIGQFGVSGLSFYDNCGTSPTSRIGISHVLNYYRALRIANQPNQLLVTILPDTVLRCFLTSFRGQVLDASRRMFEFHLGLALIPEATGLSQLSSVQSVFTTVGEGTTGGTGSSNGATDTGPEDPFGDFDDSDSLGVGYF